MKMDLLMFRAQWLPMKTIVNVYFLNQRKLILNCNSSLTETPTVTLKSNWTEFFSGEKVSLRCDIKSGESSDWEYSWFRNGVSKPEKEHEISPSQSGNYTCKGQRKRDKKESEESAAVGITVSSGQYVII